jgi:hypothetical protein
MDVAIQMLRHRAPRYTAELVEQFGKHLGVGAGKNEARVLPLKAVQPGMVIMQDVRTHLGTLLVPRGFEVTAMFLDRSRNFGPDLLAEEVKVMVQAAKPAPTDRSALTIPAPIFRIRRLSPPTVFPGSSAVERRTVNPLVVGSIPTRGANQISNLCRLPPQATRGY